MPRRGLRGRVAAAPKSFTPSSRRPHAPVRRAVSFEKRRAASVRVVSLRRPRRRHRRRARAVAERLGRDGGVERLVVGLVISVLHGGAARKRRGARSPLFFAPSLCRVVGSDRRALGGSARAGPRARTAGRRAPLGCSRRRKRHVSFCLGAPGGLKWRRRACEGARGRWWRRRRCVQGTKVAISREMHPTWAGLFRITSRPDRRAGTLSAVAS